MDRLISTTNESFDHLQNLNDTSSRNMANTASMNFERNSEDSNHGSTSLSREDEKRRIKLVMLMQQLDFLFYALVVSCYIIDGKNLIFILRTVSEVQFSQPKQIQPDRPLRFFTLASFAICVCSLISHLSILSSSTYNSNGILVDFIGQPKWKHPAITVAFLIGLDLSSCFVQLLLVLISFTQSHSISISVTTTSNTGSSRNSLMIATDRNETGERENPSLQTSSSDPGLSSKLIQIEEPLMNESSELLRKRTRQSSSSTIEERNYDKEEEAFLFDLSISEVILCLFSTNPPTNSHDETPVIATPTSTPTPSPSRVFGSVIAPSSERPGDLTEDSSADYPSTENPNRDHIPQSTAQSLISTNLPSRSVIVPIV